MIPPILFFFLRMLWLFRIFCLFHTHFRIVCFISVKNGHWHFDRDCTESIDGLGKMDILTILILLIHEHGTSFHFFVSSIFFIRVLQFSVQRYFTSLVKFISKYRIFHAIVTGIVFFHSFSDILQLVYRNETDFCMLILYLATLLNLIIISNSFWLSLQDFLYIRAYHP